MSGSTTKPRCKGTKMDGDPCKSLIIDDDGYCIAHNPETGGSERMRRMGAKGNEAQRAPTIGFTFDELNPLKTYEDAKERLDVISRAAMSGLLDDKSCNAAIRAISEWVKTESEAATKHVVEDLAKELARVKRQMGAA